jgi:hypothetical protein
MKRRGFFAALIGVPAAVKAAAGSPSPVQPDSAPAAGTLDAQTIVTVTLPPASSLRGATALIKSYGNQTLYFSTGTEWVKVGWVAAPGAEFPGGVWFKGNCFELS